MVMRQYDIFIVNLDPTVGSEIRKTRPCIVITPDEMNGPLRTVQVAPMTTNIQPFPWRVPITFQGKRGMVALDQIRTVDKARLLKRVGRISRPVAAMIKSAIQQMLVE
ncbi:MAG: type II toxin-antitoxin system PemK/MazF family toxin [Deltaproteobacteria bacterium]|nr:type II toxin-antitoxin system PemK/MazF family toxin [Deltaproteobacteria bacterium]